MDASSRWNHGVCYFQSNEILWRLTRFVGHSLVREVVTVFLFLGCKKPWYIGSIGWFGIRFDTQAAATQGL